ncbi:MAG: undecaprenyl-phosphate glucose phosphotransferase [Bacteroidota bacterium]|nr:undecaprenyl-phosphate glucose phosphotransferase [Bacteroidota bacterium]
MKSQENELVSLHLFVDVILLNITLYLVAWFSTEITSDNYNNLHDYILRLNLSWIATYFFMGKKNLYLTNRFRNRVYQITKRLFIYFIIAISLNVWLKPDSFSSLFFIEHTLCFYISMIFSYRMMVLYLSFKRDNGKNANLAIFTGENETGLLLKGIINNNPILGYNFKGYIGERESVEPEMLGAISNLPKIIKEQQIEVLFVGLRVSNNHNIDYILDTCDDFGVKVRYILENFRWRKSKLKPDAIGEIVVINPREIPLDDIRSRIVKRAFDIAFSLGIILFIFSWLFPILAILIKLTSKGPIFFVQQRTGVNNKTFNCLKFRSMRVNNEAHIRQATEFDDRITRLGKFLRKSSIDELPQFINVLMGHMSVIGPRPHMLKHTDQYSELINHYKIRHYIKPGITGWAQVNGYRGETNELWKMERRVEYDMHYIHNWSFGLDLKIVFLTVVSRKVLQSISKSLYSFVLKGIEKKDVQTVSEQEPLHGTSIHSI